MSRVNVIGAVTSILLIALPATAREDCIECHSSITPAIVTDWELSRHSGNDVGCPACHGEGHDTADNVDQALIPTPETCATCHKRQVEQHERGKHSMAWAAMKAMPTIHWQPMAMTEGLKGCGGCHKVGLKDMEELQQLKREGSGFGVAACDSCHTRHLFLAEEARQPQACRTCHTGFDHPQWEMYSSSKHGVRYLLKQTMNLPEEAGAPTCQDCHMQAGDHEVRTAWGYLAVRLPMPENAQWAADRTAILQALGVLDPKGQPTERLEVVATADMARLDEEAWLVEREKMLGTCNQCHSRNFAKAELEKGDAMIREADHLTAEAIRIVAKLYESGVLSRPRGYLFHYPDLLTFHNAPTPIEQRLFVMFFEHRMHAFQGAFHSNPDYALWRGWSELQRDLTEIREMATELNRRARISATRPGG